MKRYLLSVYQPDGDPPASVDLERIMQDVNALKRRDGVGRCLGLLRWPAPAQHRHRGAALAR